MCTSVRIGCQLRKCMRKATASTLRMCASHSPHIVHVCRGCGFTREEGGASGMQQQVAKREGHSVAQQAHHFGEDTRQASATTLRANKRSPISNKVRSPQDRVGYAIIRQSPRLSEDVTPHAPVPTPAYPLLEPDHLHDHGCWLVHGLTPLGAPLGLSTHGGRVQQGLRGHTR